MKRSAWVQTSGALALVLGVVLLTPAGRAAAHAAYDHSTPAKDEVVPTAPSQVDVYFKQDVFKQAGSYYLRVFSDAGSQVTDDGTVDDNDRTHMSVALPRGLAQGRYTVHWKTTSDEDGEEDSGAFCFYVGVQPTAAQQAECASFAPTPVPTIADATAQASPATTQSVSPTPAPTPGSTSSGASSSTGVVLGVVGVIVAVVIVGGAGLWWRSRRA